MDQTLIAHIAPLAAVDVIILLILIAGKFMLSPPDWVHGLHPVSEKTKKTKRKVLVSAVDLEKRLQVARHGWRSKENHYSSYAGKEPIQTTVLKHTAPLVKLDFKPLSAEEQQQFEALLGQADKLVTTCEQMPYQIRERGDFHDAVTEQLDELEKAVQNFIAHVTHNTAKALLSKQDTLLKEINQDTAFVRVKFSLPSHRPTGSDKP